MQIDDGDLRVLLSIVQKISQKAATNAAFAISNKHADRHNVEALLRRVTRHCFETTTDRAHNETSEISCKRGMEAAVL